MADITNDTLHRIEEKQHDAAILQETAKSTGWNRTIAVATSVAVIVSLLSWLVLVTIDRTSIADRISVLDRDAIETRSHLVEHDKDIGALKLTAVKIDTTLEIVSRDIKQTSDKLDKILQRHDKP